MKKLTWFGNIIIDKKIVESFEWNAFLTSGSKLILGAINLKKIVVYCLHIHLEGA